MLALYAAAPARAQESPLEVAERVHRAGGYPSDVIPLVPGSAAGGVGGIGQDDGAGRGPRGETTLGDREAGDRGTGDGGAIEGAIRELLRWVDGLARLVGGPLAWVLLAIGLVLVIMLAAYVVVRMRIGTAAHPIEARAGGDEQAIDPLLLAPPSRPTTSRRRGAGARRSTRSSSTRSGASAGTRAACAGGPRASWWRGCPRGARAGTSSASCSR